MSRGKELKSIAYAIAQKFSSRNNDLGGLWAMGPIFGVAQEYNRDAVHFDLLAKEIDPNISRLKPIIESFLYFLNFQIEVRHIRHSRIKKVTIDVIFNRTRKRPSSVSARYTEHPYNVVVSVESNHGLVYKGEANGWCYPV